MLITYFWTICNNLLFIYLVSNLLDLFAKSNWDLCWSWNSISCCVYRISCVYEYVCVAFYMVLQKFGEHDPDIIISNKHEIYLTNLLWFIDISRYEPLSKENRNTANRHTLSEMNSSFELHLTWNRCVRHLGKCLFSEKTKSKDSSGNIVFEKKKILYCLCLHVVFFFQKN